MIKEQFNPLPAKLKPNDESTGKSTFSRKTVGLNLLLLLIMTHVAFPQNSLQDEVYKQYKERTNPSLYNGIAYPSYLDENIYHNKHAFLRDSLFKAGTLVYSGRFYKDVALKYDIILDEVVILHQFLESEVVLRRSEVSEFSIGDDHFINIPEGKNIPPGYYEIVLKGKTKVLRKHKKTYRYSIPYLGSTQNVIDEYDPKYYIENNRQFNLVKNEKSLYDIFPDKKKELKDFIQKNDLLIKESPGTSLRLVAEFIDK
ncbi:hypothetical protein [Pedobacter gandavensis]|uniref:hypothetical protein n=1 Tax=Pedobacter gandavensis TaxID=2679963 RepID=UPI002931B6B2|nr:hypothetical protein [Pedobacter gandavensis]